MRARSLLLVTGIALLLVGCRHRSPAPAPYYVQVAPAQPAAAPPTPVVAQPAAPALDAEDPNALVAALRAGNERYVSGHALHPRQDAARRGEVAGKQLPKVVVLACADSRTAPEVVFDQGLGDLSVVRVAGNVVTDEVTASIEYAVEHLGVRLIVVLGHERCGAVHAALAGGELPGHLPSLIDRIKPAVAAVGPADAHSANHEADVVAANAKLAADALRGSAPILAEAVAHHHLAVVAAVYDLDDGNVKFLPTP